MTDQNGNWFTQNGFGDPAAQPQTASVAAPPTPETSAQPAGNWFEQNGFGQKEQPAEAAAPSSAPERSTWDNIKSAVAGPSTAVGTPMGETKGQEISGINDLIHGEFAKGGSKIWNSEKIDAKNIAPGSPVEWAIRQFDPDFHGKATKEAVEAMKAKNQNPGEKPLVDIAQFVDKGKHPIAKALTEVGQGLTSPENLAIMYGTGGMGLIGKAPQAVKALGVMNKLISAGFAYQALQGAYEHSKAFMDAMNNGDANEAEYQLTHALASGTMAVQAGSHAAEGVAVPGSNMFGAKGIVPVEHAMPFLSDTDKAVLGKTAEVVGKAAQAGADFTKQKATDAADLMGRAVGRTDNFDQAITAAAGKLGNKVGPEFREKVGRVSDDLKAIINNDVNNKIVSPGTAADAIQSHLNSLEAPLQAEAGATRDSAEPVVPNFSDRLRERLDKFFDNNRQKYGSIEQTDAIKDKIMERLIAQHDVGGLKVDRDPNLYEAENARQGLSKSSGDVFETGTSDGYRAASADTANFLREVIDESYDNKGVSNVKETRQKEADLIDIRDALRDVQGRYEAQNNTPAILKLFTLGKGAAIAGAIGAHFLGGNIPGGLLTAGTAWKAAHDYYSKNLPSNFNRAIDLANREQGAQATTTGSVPPVQGPQVPPPQAAPPPPGPGQPNIPPAPTPPTPATPPAVNHALNGALSSYFGKFLNKVPYDQLMQKFVDQVADMEQDIQNQKDNPGTKPKYSQEQIDKAEKLQTQINSEHAREHAQMEKEDKTAQAKYTKDRTKWEQQRDDIVRKHAEEQAAKIEQEKAAAAAQQKAEDDAKASDERVAHSPFMKSTDKALEISGVEGRPSNEAAEHEHGHIMANVAEGLNPIAFVTDTHPDAIENNAAAQIHTDVSGAEEGNKGLAQRVVGVLGGPAFDEVHHGVTLGRNTGARGDIMRAREILREEGGLRGNQLEKVFDALYDRAKEHVSNPEALALVQANAPLREAGLHPNFHMSPGRLEEYVKKLKGAYRNGQTPSTEGVREGDSDGGISEGEPAGAGGRGEEQDGAVEGVRAEAARESDGETAKPESGKEKSGLELPKERTTGRPETDEAIRKGGGIPGGTMEGFPYKEAGETKQYPDTHLFHDPESGTTLALKQGDVTPEAVAEKLRESRAKYAAAKAEKSSLTKEEPKTISDKLVDTYGTTQDPHDARFILNDGRMVPGTQTHNEMLQNIYEKYGDVPTDDAERTAFINNEKAVRTRYRTGKGGAEVVFSVPKEGGVSEEQIQKMRQSVGKLRNGNVVMETSDSNGKSAQKEFARPSDVDDMLRQIGAHPETEKSSLSKTADAGSHEHDLDWQERFGPEAKTAKSVADSANDYNKQEGRGAVSPERIPHSPEVAKQIADAYEAMKHDPENPEVKASYQAFKNDIDKQWDYATKNMGMKLEPWTGEGQPYANSKEMVNDVRNNKHLYFYQGGEHPAGHPMMEVDPETGLSANDKFRAVHDLFGHAAHENQFGPKGEENAWNDHRQMFSPEAIPAMTAETRGQNSWVNFGPHLRDEQGNVPAKGEEGYVPVTERPYAEQKAGILPPQFSNPNIEKSALTKGSSVPLMENPLKVKGSGDNGKISTVDVAQALNKFSKKQHPALDLDEENAPAMVERAKKIAEDEAKYQLAQGKTGTEWYTTEMQDHDAALRAMRPEFAGGEPIDAPTAWDHNPKLSLFKAVEAITSSGQKPYGNLKSALKVWDIYHSTGEFPATQLDGKSWGPRGAAAYGNAMGMLNKLVTDKGEKGAAEWLLSEHPVSELKELNTGVKGKKTDMAPGAMILGEKRGPFMQNLHGIESAFTADMWVTRTWNRWMGTMETGKNSFTGEPEVQPAAPRNKTERDLMHQSFADTADKLKLSTSSLQAVLWYYEQALYSKQGIPKESWSFRDAAQRVEKEQPKPEEAEEFNFGHNEKEKGFMGLPARPSTFANIGKIEKSSLNLPETYATPKGWNQNGPTKGVGMVSPGNINLTNRPVVKNDDGTTSSEYSTSFQDDKGHEVIVPTVVDGKFLTPDGKKPKVGSPEEAAMKKAAWEHYKQTGQHLGIYDTPEHADAAAESIHSRPRK